MNDGTSKKTIATRSVRAGLESDAQHGSVVPPIYLSTNFAFEGYRKPRKYDYTAPAIPRATSWPARLRIWRRGGCGGDLHGPGCHHLDPRDAARRRARAGAVRLLRRNVSPARRAREAGQSGGRLHRPERSGRARQVARIETRAGVDRDTEQSVAAHRRHPRDRRRRACGGRAGGGRQYLSLAGMAAAARARRGPGHAFDHQVSERPQRRGGRRGHRVDRRTAAEPVMVGETPSASPARPSTAS